MDKTTTMKTFDKLVEEELKRARKQHGNMQSLHEAYSVILEEVDEFWEHVKMKSKNRNPQEILGELVQISAMCQKTAEDVVIPEIDKLKK